ncbi:hypothetical protein [Teredinibacter purpureus]|uniref:hypothetical protein n=1 Tax=Teredinibacter purpureus TaxID=2731756 RepID=UPI0005F89583|nr:hypothetical protein [Teredinibacter purpureus]
MNKKKEVKLLRTGEIECSFNGESTVVGFDSKKISALTDKLSSEVAGFGLGSDYANEIYLLFYFKLCEWSVQLDDLHCEDIKTGVGGVQGVLWRSMLKGRRGLPVYTLIRDYFRSVILTIMAFSVVVIGGLLSPMYVLWQTFMLGKGGSLSSRACIVRSSATYSKMCLIKDDLNMDLYAEDIAYKKTNLSSMFSLLSVNASFYSVLKIPFIVGRDFCSILRDAYILLGFQCVGDIVWYFSRRIVVKAIYEITFIELCRLGSVKSIYTGNKEDRYAMLESRIASNNNKELICIPHGLEYSIKFPGGVAGDIFYSTSQVSAECLNKLYGTTKFVYDQALMNRIFSRACLAVDNEGKGKKVVYFSESRDTHVNLSIVKTLYNLGVDFSVKLHPKDSKSNYSHIGFNLIFIDDYVDAICNRICVARKSTVLLEALFNGSISIAYLENSKDKYYVEHLFPSLQAKGIKQVFCESDLKEELSLILEGK